MNLEECQTIFSNICEEYCFEIYEIKYTNNPYSSYHKIFTKIWSKYRNLVNVNHHEYDKKLKYITSLGDKIRVDKDTWTWINNKYKC